MKDKSRLLLSVIGMIILVTAIFIIIFTIMGGWKLTGTGRDYIASYGMWSSLAVLFIIGLFSGFKQLIRVTMSAVVIPCTMITVGFTMDNILLPFILFIGALVYILFVIVKEKDLYKRVVLLVNCASIPLILLFLVEPVLF